MEKRQWSYRYYLLVAVGILLAGIFVAGCGPASPMPGTVAPPPGTVTPPPEEIKVVTVPTCRVRRELPEVWAGPSDEPVLPRLEDEDWRALPDGGRVTTDDNGEGWVDISQEDKTCMRIYIFQDSELIKAPCPKSDYTERNVTCFLAGTSVYNNSFAGEVIVQTLSAEIQLEGTWVAVGYLPEQQVTIVMVFDADEEKVDKVTVWPVQKLDPRILGEPPVEVIEEHFWFSMPGGRAAPIADLEARVAHPFKRLLPLVEVLDLWAWIDRIKVRADADNVPYPDFPPFGPAPTWTPTPETPTSTLTPTPTLINATVQVKALSLRSGPGTEYAIIAKLTQGDFAIVIGQNPGGNWLKVEHEGRTGWVAKEYVEVPVEVAMIPTVEVPPTVTPTPTDTPIPTATPTDTPKPTGPIAFTIYLRSDTDFVALSGDQQNGGMIYEEGKFVYGEVAVQIGDTVYHFDKPEVEPGEPEQLPDPWRVEFEFAEELLAHTGNQAGFDAKKAQFWVGTLDGDSAAGEDNPYSLTIKLYEGNELRGSIQVSFAVGDAPSGGGDGGGGGYPPP